MKSLKTHLGRLSKKISSPTPGPATQDVSGDEQSVTMTATPSNTRSAFFNLLPLELRRQILIHAFGGRTMHAVLLSSIQGSVPDPDSRQHIARRRPHAVPRLWPGKVKSKEPARRWVGCVCHCWMSFDDDFGASVVHDPCARPRADWWDFKGSLKPDQCLVGAMGWLLTCRQA